MKQVLITDDVHPILLDDLREMGFQVDYQPGISNTDTLKIISTYSGLIVSTKTQVNKQLLDAAVKLEFVGRVGSGMEFIDVEYARKKKIKVYSSPEGNANAVGEHALGLLLALMNRISIADAQIRNGIWKREENRGVEIAGKTIGIIGYGNTGSSFARKLTGLDCTILVYDKYKIGFGSSVIKEVTLDFLKAHAQIVSLHLPLTAQTKFWINQRSINEFQNQFYLINTSRGGIVNTPDLINGLQSGKILGVGLDVFENESFYQLDEGSKLHFKTLSTMHNAVLTPHIAGWTNESNWKLARILTDKIRENFD